MLFSPHCYNESRESDDLKGVERVLKRALTALVMFPKSSAPQSSWYQSLGLWRTRGKKREGRNKVYFSKK